MMDEIMCFYVIYLFYGKSISGDRFRAGWPRLRRQPAHEQELQRLQGISPKNNIFLGDIVFFN